jgi:hypothetical protein
VSKHNLLGDALSFREVVLQHIGLPLECLNGIEELSFSLHPGFEEEVPSVASGSSAAGLSDSPLALAPDDFFLFFPSSDILSLDFREDSYIGFPSSTEEEVGEFIAHACVN